MSKVKANGFRYVKMQQLLISTILFVLVLMALACMVHNRCHAYWSANASILSFYDVQLLQKLPIKCSTPSVEVYCILCHTRRCLTLTCLARNCNTSNTRYTYVPIAFALWSSIILFCSYLCHPSKEQIVPTGRMFTSVSNIADYIPNAFRFNSRNFQNE